MLNVRIRTGNAAFSDGNKEHEVSRLLAEAASRIRDGERKGTLMDINGNTVGRFTLTNR